MIAVSRPQCNNTIFLSKHSELLGTRQMLLPIAGTRMYREKQQNLNKRLTPSTILPEVSMVHGLIAPEINRMMIVFQPDQNKKLAR
ncbi:hypothetical protein Mapa_001832 [Marchantia paleacea]|nr:hypothetical protein Mapa_001832 [Marchantia paleacea]